MTDRQETIADIIAEMKRRKEMLENAAFNAPLCYSTETVQAQHEILDEFIERFETAHRRELARVDSVIDEAVHGYPPEDIDDNREIGNGAKLREALELMNDLFERGVICTSYANSAEEMEQIEELYRKTKSALAAPPRNCDVGTAREQEKRHKEEVCPKSACPKHEGFVSNACKGCFAMWSQMPYEEGGAK